MVTHTDYSGVIIDWSCSDSNICKKIREKVKKRTGIECDDTIYGGLPILRELGQSLIEASQDLLAERMVRKSEEVQEKES